MKPQRQHVLGQEAPECGGCRKALSSRRLVIHQLQ